MHFFAKGEAVRVQPGGPGARYLDFQPAEVPSSDRDQCPVAVTRDADRVLSVTARSNHSRYGTKASSAAPANRTTPQSYDALSVETELRSPKGEGVCSVLAIAFINLNKRSDWEVVAIFS